MAKIENKAEYYFGNKPVIEKSPDEDEFEGSFTNSVDLELLEQIRRLNLPTFWERIWIELATLRCGFKIIDESTIGLEDISPLAREKYPFGKQRIWSENVTGARKKGWDWSGDTDVYASTINGPKTLEEAVIAVMLSEPQFWMYLNEMGEPNAQSAYQNWKSFFDYACRTDEHDLPAWKGKPERDVVLKFDGNTGIHLAEKSGGTYVLVEYMTS